MTIRDYLFSLYQKVDRIDVDLEREGTYLRYDIGDMDHTLSRISELSGCRRDLIEEIERVAYYNPGIH